MLIGSENYPLWKRKIELALSAKRKLGYVTGKTAKPKEDEDKIEAWTVSNNQVITWILQNDELENLSTLPTITKVTTEIVEYLTAVEKHAEERRLFQFLNGLDKEYGILRSNILLKDPLPGVNHTVSLMLQEEQQTSNLSGARIQEGSALLGKGEHEKDRCIHYGRNNHRSELCWEIKGYPVGHPKHKKRNFKSGFRGGYKSQKPYQAATRKMSYKSNASNVKVDQTDLTAAIGAATLQIENLLKQVPNGTHTNRTGGDSEEELECNFAGMIQNAQNECSNGWIIDSGASNHVTSKFKNLKNVNELSKKLRINLPDGRFVRVTHR
ncbi:hypothetical protein RND81_10G040900 [Saponaria officinalis]|uniref:Retrotransposon Copia-like N-terminal domain-containing protein n=1 Tax=Saponaria officinalis TaxID=3572 RepID=A0AAW1I073_SAPOF